MYGTPTGSGARDERARPERHFTGLTLGLVLATVVLFVVAVGGVFFVWLVFLWLLYVFHPA